MYVNGKTRINPSTPVTLDHRSDICFGTPTPGNELKYKLITPNSAEREKQHKLIRTRAAVSPQEEVRCSTNLPCENTGVTPEPVIEAAQTRSQGSSGGGGNSDISRPSKKPRIEEVMCTDDAALSSQPRDSQQCPGNTIDEDGHTRNTAQSTTGSAKTIKMTVSSQPTAAPTKERGGVTNTTQQPRGTSRRHPAHTPHSAQSTTGSAKTIKMTVSSQPTAAPTEERGGVTNTTQQPRDTSRRHPAHTPRPLATPTNHQTPPTSRLDTPASTIDDLFSDCATERDFDEIVSDAIFGDDGAILPSADPPQTTVTSVARSTSSGGVTAVQYDGTSIQIQAARNDMEREKQKLLTSIEALKSELASKERLLVEKSEKEEEGKRKGEGVIDSMQEEFTCVICQELFVEAHTLSCAHSFCKCCINSWVKTKKECPMCRKPISSKPVRSLVLDNAIDRMVEKIGPAAVEEREKLKQLRMPEIVKEAAASMRSITRIGGSGGGGGGTGGQSGPSGTSSGSSGGHTGTTSGRSGTTSGRSGTTSGHSGTTSGTSSGRSGTSSGRSGTSSGHRGTSGTSGGNGGTGGPSGGTSDTTGGPSGGTGGTSGGPNDHRRDYDDYYYDDSDDYDSYDDDEYDSDDSGESYASGLSGFYYGGYGRCFTCGKSGEYLENCVLKNLSFCILYIYRGTRPLG